MIVAAAFVDSGLRPLLWLAAVAVIVLWLAGSSCSVRELEQVTGLSQSLVSYHLRELRDAGLVASTAAGRSNRYRLSSVELDQLAGLIGGLQVEAPATA